MANTKRGRSAKENQVTMNDTKPVVEELSKKEVKELLDRGKVTSRMDQKLIDHFKSLGFTFDEYAMEKIANGIHVAIEFCIGDFCVGVFSKRGKWLLEDKKSFESFWLALLQVKRYEKEIEEGKHWAGEED